MLSRIREEEGIGLVELLVAMIVMSIGIFALVAGFSSGFGSINRASKASTAAALADKQMEALRRGPWTSVVSSTLPPTTGPDGRTYFIETVVVSKCPDETDPVGTFPTWTCTLSDGTNSRPVVKATVTVKDGSSASAPLLIAESSTFDRSIG